MLQALLADLLELRDGISDLRLLAMNDSRVPLRDVDRRIQPVTIGPDERFRSIWLDCISQCDAVWPIAPETGGILEQLCRDVEVAGKPLLTSPSAAVRLAASKLQTARRLSKFGVPTVPTLPLREWKAHQGAPFVIKPDDGAGCCGTRIISHPAGCRMQENADGWIAQPLIEGDPLSLSAIFARGKARLLSSNRQEIRRQGEGFSLSGCLTNTACGGYGLEYWQDLAERVAQAIPELWGYAGIDLILTDGRPAILEINPRLTTSYAGIRRSTGENPAAMVLDLFETGRLPPLRRHLGKTVEIGLENARGH